MELHLSAEQKAFLQQNIQSGRFRTVDEALSKAVALLQEREGILTSEPPAVRKSLAQLFSESPFRGFDMEFPREQFPLREIDL